MNIPSDDSVLRSYESEHPIKCPRCEESAVRFVPIGLDTEIDTVGTVNYPTYHSFVENGGFQRSFL